MRSVAALAALALTGAFDLAAASRCKPSSVTSATSLDTTTASSLDTSMTSLDTSATETSTGTAGESTGTAAPGSVIKNIVTNGGFSKKDPGGDPSKIPGFTVTGDSTLVTGGGYTGDGSSDKNAVQLSVSSTPPGKRKRQTARGETAGFGQFLDNLDTRTQYTVQFFYYIVTAPAQRTMCVLQAGLGNGIFFNTFIYSTGQATFYERIVVQTSAPSVGADIFIHSSCQNGGLSTIFVDSLFMSNQVTPETIDSYSLDFGGDIHNPPVEHDPVTTSNAEGTSTQEPSETSTFPSNGDQSTSFSLQPTEVQSTTQQDSGRTSSFVTVTSETAATSTEAPSTVTESLPECTLAESDGCSYIGGGTGCFRYGRQVDTFFLAGDHSSWHCEALCGEMPDRCKSSAWDNDANMCRFSSRSINDPDFGSGSGPELSWNDQACFKCFCHDADRDRYFRTVSEHDGQTDAPTTTSGATNTAVETTTEATTTSNADSGETTTPAETTTTTTTTLDFNIDETTTSAAFEETTTTLLSEDTTTSGNGASNGPNTKPTTTNPGSSSQTNTCSTKDAVQNGGFESDLASDGWAFKGQAGVTNNGDLGQTRTGGKAAFLRWPSVNTKAGFSQNIGGLEIGKPYTLSYWHHTAEGKKLDLDECDILVRFDNKNFDNFDPFYDNRAPNGYVNRYNTVYPTSTVAPLSFELSCNGNNPDPFVIMMDDISLIPTCGRQNQQEED